MRKQRDRTLLHQTDLIMTFLSAAASFAWLFGWREELFVETAQRCFLSTIRMAQVRKDDDHEQRERRMQ